MSEKEKGQPKQVQKKIFVFKVKHLTDQGEDRVFRMDKARMIGGSMESADIRIQGPQVSPFHFVIERGGTPEAPTAQLFDLASDSGVLLNGEKVITSFLKSKDVIQIGAVTIRFEMDDGAKLGSHSIRQSGARTLYVDPKEDLRALLLEHEGDVADIFDYRTTQQQALEVVMSWSETILEVEHFVEKHTITAGPSLKDDFGIPTQTGHGPLVTKEQGQFIIHLDPLMTGVLKKDGDFVQIQDWLKEGKSRSIALQTKDFAKIRLGNVDFYLGFSSAPPRLKLRRLLKRDPFFSKVLWGSFILTLAVGAALAQLELPPAEPEQLPERIATILYTPEQLLSKPMPSPTPPPKPTPTPTPTPTPPKPKPSKPPEPIKPKVEPPKPKPPEPPKKIELKPEPPKPKPPAPPKVLTATAPAKPPVAPPKPAQPAPKALQSGAKEGEGARAKGEAGSRGEPDKPKSQVHQDKLNRPSPDMGASGASGQSEEQDQGNVNILKNAGGRVADILGNSAAKLGDGGSLAKGSGHFTTQGSGGLALSGQGRGGGGDAESTLGGLGKKGSGMGRVGTGRGASGTGSGIAGAGAGHLMIQMSGPEDTVVMGTIDQNLLHEALRAHKDEFVNCYNREINAENPNLAGKVKVRWTIGASGRVSKAGVDSSTINNRNVEACVVGVIKRIKFPMPEGAGDVEVTYPFNFSHNS
jgi:TonB family protein